MTWPALGAPRPMMSRIVVDFPDSLEPWNLVTVPVHRETQIVHGKLVAIALGEALRLDHFSSCT